MKTQIGWKKLLYRERKPRFEWTNNERGEKPHLLSNGDEKKRKEEIRVFRKKVARIMILFTPSLDDID